MVTTALRETWSRKRRLGGTVFAVFLGVALLCGAFVLSDTLGRGIKGFFANNYNGVDVVVRSATTLGSGPNPTRAPIPASLVRRVADVPGVDEARPVIDGYAQIVGPDGKAVTGNGPRTAGNWLGGSPLNPYRMYAGRPPRADGEVVIDKATAQASGLHAGSRTTVLAPDPHPVTVTGIVTFGASDAFGGSSYVGFDLAAAQRYLARPGQVSSIDVRADGGIGKAALAARIAGELPSGVQAVPGTVAAEEATRTVDEEFLSTFKTVLSALAALSLLVAVFSIFNTQTILTAQRARESALLRAIGASRRQIFAAAIAESAIVGAAASALGIGGGLGIAYALKGIFAGMNLTLPGSGLAVRADGVLIAFAVGVLVTVMAGLIPARRASRVAPLAAVRDMSAAAIRPGRGRTWAGASALLFAVGLITVGLTAGRALPAAVGAILGVGAAITIGPVAAGPAVRMVTGAFGRRRNSTARLAGRNAQRDPHRVSSAATALLVGTALVAGATVLAASLRASRDDSVAGTLRADLVISPANANGAPASLSPQVAQVAQRTPGVTNAAAVGTGTLRLAGDATSATVVDPTRLSGLLDLGVHAGGTDAVHGNVIAVRHSLADDRGWHVGSAVPVRFPDGHTVTARIGAEYTGRGLVSDVVIAPATWSAHSAQQRASSVLVDVAPSTDIGQVQDRLAVALKPYGEPPVRDRAGFIDASSAQIGMALNLVYAMLALAVLIAVLGIANTISLSVFERTRELGLLRAIGLTRRQTRTLVRVEAVIVAALGSLAGVVLGALGGAAVVASTDSAALHRLAVPAGPLIVILLGGALSGVLAAARPARRAARLDVLSALAAT
jgi:putative ABC transport system permease protein